MTWIERLSNLQVPKNYALEKRNIKISYEFRKKIFLNLIEKIQHSLLSKVKPNIYGIQDAAHHKKLHQ